MKPTKNGASFQFLVFSFSPRMTLLSPRLLRESSSFCLQNRQSTKQRRSTMPKDNRIIGRLRTTMTHWLFPLLGPLLVIPCRALPLSTGLEYLTAATNEDASWTVLQMKRKHQPAIVEGAGDGVDERASFLKIITLHKMPPSPAYLSQSFSRLCFFLAPTLFPPLSLKFPTFILSRKTS